MQYTQFCQYILEVFPKKNLSILNLIIALASDGKARSVTELSNNPLYKYGYSSISDAIHSVFQKDDKDSLIKVLEKRFVKDKEFLKIFANYFPKKFRDKYYLLNTDASSIYREHSFTLEDLGFVYKSNEVFYSNKPVTIGYSMSTVGINAREDNVSWNLPLSILRIPTECNTNEFTAKQVLNLLSDEPFLSENLVVNALDSGYCNINYIYPTDEQENLVNVIRMRANRKVYLIYQGAQLASGRDKEYGHLFKLNDKQTHTDHTEKEIFEQTLQNGRQCRVEIRKWDNMIVCGEKDRRMSDKPFNLIAVDVYDLKTDKKIFVRTMWLSVWGKRKDELSLSDIYQSYRLRFDIEFFFRFGKQKLLLDKFQTPDVEHQENWFIIVMLSYWLLYLNRKNGEIIINEWEKYLEKYKNIDVKEQKNAQIKSPTITQRAMPNILLGFVNEFIIPKTRKNKTGRKKGDKQVPRKRHKVVKKSKKVKIQKE